MKNIAILTGGDSVEYNISLQSAKTVIKNLPDSFKAFTVHLKEDNYTVILKNKNLPVNRNNFSFILDNKEIKFDIIFITIHGPPAENGAIQDYFDKLKIPYTSCNAKISKITFDKYICNNKLLKLGYKCAKSKIIKQGNDINEDNIIKNIGLPCFVKPNASGSSYGVSKVYEEEKIRGAIKNAFKYDTKVLIEEFINGTELSCGIYFNGTDIQTLPITEIVSKNDFFDYNAKYKGESNEITPARISKGIEQNIHQTSISIYKKMNLRGICRIDYIIMKKILYIIEINTIPGLSEESIIPKQIQAANLSLKDFFGLILLNTKN